MQEQSAWHTLGPLMDLITPMALRVAATLRLADLLAESPTPVEELAASSDTNPEALRRLMRQLTCHGVFTEPEPDTFANNEISTLLHSDHPTAMRTWLDLEGFGGQMDLPFTELLHTVRTGEPAWSRVYGAEFWEHLAADPAMSASFDATMSAGSEYVADTAAGYDWSSATHVVDVGGGDGTLLADVLHANPHLRATLVDLPDTVARGRVNLREFADRCAFVGQSFFEPLPAGHDVYVLCGVVHDWSDDDAVAILRRCADAAGDTGRVVVVESHGTDGSDPRAFAEMNLRMLVLCGGKERSVDEYRTLAERAGLAVTDVHATPLGHAVFTCVMEGQA